MDPLLGTFIVLLVVIDPIGLAPLFYALARHQTRAQQRRTAVQSVALATGMLLIFFFIGDALLRVLGIGMPAFRIAGGALLFLLAIDMVFARQSGLRSTTAREQEEAVSRSGIAVFPLAFPLIAGPGSLTTVLLMASTWGSRQEFIGMLVVLLAVLLLALLSLLAAPYLMRLLGETGANVVSRLLGLILAALAVQYILDGVTMSLTGQS
ncbi:MAG: NAAT family transporter [Gammaproteobacteria bacterium]|nr:NAAT family transporter [Gammaproteobacteria bacterium]